VGGERKEVKEAEEGKEAQERGTVTQSSPFAENAQGKQRRGKNTEGTEKIKRRKERARRSIVRTHPSLKSAKDGAPSSSNGRSPWTEKRREKGKDYAEVTEFAEKMKIKRKERARCPIVRAHPSLKNAKGGAPSST
jgi:2-oxo-4-hydroxy-4-carboxy--5-ureidoimidazoline (OHCU) decarboxylase